MDDYRVGLGFFSSRYSATTDAKVSVLSQVRLLS